MKKIGKYKILGIIGKGGMGIVYRALDPDIEREVAIKTIRFDTLTEGAEKEEMLARVIREAKAAGRLNHPNIVTIYDVVRDKSLTHIVMQYVDGQSLQALVDSGKTFSPAEIVALLRPVGEALDYAHQNGIVHRDIKPANILIEKGGQPYLADFGVARIETSTMTQAGTTVGTLSYMSPEQVKGETVDSRSDIFALGVVLYELLTGKKPFPGENLSTIVYKIVHEAPPQVTSINKELPAGYEFVIEKSLAKDPQCRYQSCREMIGELEAARSAGESQTTPSPELGGPARTFRPRRKNMILAGAGLFAVLSVGAGLLFFFPRSHPAAVTAAKLESDLQKVKNEGLNPTTRSGPTAPSPAPSPTDDLVTLRQKLDAGDSEGAVKEAEAILAREPSNAAARDGLNQARSRILAARVAPLLQTGMANYNSGNYVQCLQAMDRVLKIDKDNKEAQKYLFLADTALSKREIETLLESHRVAVETKDLVAAVNPIGPPELSQAAQADCRLLFNGYDGIKSAISDVAVKFDSRWNATVSFSELLTAVYRKDGQRRIVYQGKKSWELRKQEKGWQIMAIR
jgi:serine/threonine protein kinase